MVPVRINTLKSGLAASVKAPWIVPVKPALPWAVKWRCENRLDGHVDHLEGRYGFLDVPGHVAGYNTMVFKTREEARQFIRLQYGYIRERPDLQRGPHGWKMPIPVRVVVLVVETSTGQEAETPT